MRYLLLSLAALFASSYSGVTAPSEDQLKRCLNPGPNMVECANYLAELMQEVRFGTSVRRPFCVPNRELTAEESNLVFKKFYAENPHFDKYKAMMAAAVIATKAEKCR